jgi:hypothetical protein
MQKMLSHQVREIMPTITAADYKGAARGRKPGTPEYRSNLCEYTENSGTAIQLTVLELSQLFSDQQLKETPAGPVDKITRLARALALQRQMSVTTKTMKASHGGRGYLNPYWAEWLMGWPIGWTDLKPLATDKFRNVQQWHSLFSQKD